MITYNAQGICAKQIDFELDNGILKSVHFTGGCPGNLKAISTLLEGMPAAEAIQKLRGITCGNKTTSCSDQLAQALQMQLEK